MPLAVCALALAVSLAVSAPARGASTDCESFASLRARTIAIWALWPAGGRAVWAWTREGLQRWDGCRWNNEGLPGGEEPGAEPALWAAGASDVWAAVSHRIPGQPTGAEVYLDAESHKRSAPVQMDTALYRWTGGAWRELARVGPSPRQVHALWGTGPTDVRLVVSDAAPPRGVGSELWRWDGRRLRPMKIALGGAPLPADLALAGGSSTRLSWIAGAHTVLIGSGRSWRLTELPEDFYVWDVAGARPSDLWAVGGGGAPRAFHFDGERWTPHTVPDGLARVALTDTGVPIARGLWGTMYAWDGADWTIVLERAVSDQADAAPWATCVWGDEGHEERLNLRRDGQGRAVLVGARTLLGWQGERWPAGAVAEETATAVWESPAGEAWATTAAHWNDHASPLGALLRFRDGRWERAFEGGAPMLVVAGHRGRIWAAGMRGALVACEADRCAAVPSGTNEDLVSLWEMDGRLWLGSSRGGLFTLDDASGRWQLRANGNRKRAVAAMAGTSFARIYAADRNGLLHWDGHDWGSDLEPCQFPSSASATSSGFWAVATRGPTDLWTLGWCRASFRETSGIFPMCGDSARRGSSGGQSTAELSRYDGVRWQKDPAVGCSVSVTADGVWTSGAEGKLVRASASGQRSVFDAGTLLPVRQVLPSKSGHLWIVTANDPTPLRVNAIPDRAP